MDKLKSIAIIKYFFSSCFKLDVDVQFSTEENAYLIGFNEYDLEGDNWAYMIYPFKDKFVQWSFETKYFSDIYINTSYVAYNKFTDCLEGIMKHHLEVSFYNAKQSVILGLFDDDETF